MSIHPSLASSDKDKKQKSVLKRSERIKTMIEKGAWKQGDKVFGLPKMKTLRIKIKKEKIEKTEAATAEGTAPAAATTAAPAAKSGPAKAQEKK